jgi:phenylglyoxylate dehydrogenase beta subunit
VFYDTLVVKKGGLCPPDCELCVRACPNKAFGGTTAIKKVKLEENAYSVSICNQCSQPACIEICPVEALTRNDKGVTELDSEICIGCGECVDVCPYDGIHLDASDELAVKCDYCQGEPKCVDACPNGILSWVQSRKVLEQFQGEDPFSPGLTYCAGCTAEQAVRFTARVLGSKIILFSAPGCSILAERSKLPYFGCLMTNVSSTMTGVKRYLTRIGEDVTCVAFVGDGCSADVGFQPLSGACERGENIIHICYDNEAYMNTGIQRSSTTPAGSWTTTTPVGPASRGKKRTPKYMPLVMAFQGAAYVATATLSHLEDFARKLRKAQKIKDGLSYIHLFAPCPTGWRAKIDSGIELCRLAVETNYFPLWEAEDGVFCFTSDDHKSRPLIEFLKLQRRFEHLGVEEIHELQAMANQRFELIRHLTKHKR